MSTSSPSGSEQRNQHKQLDQHSDKVQTTQLWLRSFVAFCPAGVLWWRY